jgi:hypothetical protein
MEKRCCHCRITKPSTDFAKNRTTPDQLQRWCRQCASAADREWYSKNGAKKRAARSAYYQQHAAEINAKRAAQYAASKRGADDHGNVEAQS